MADVHIYAPLCIAAGAIFPPVCTCLVAVRFVVIRQQKRPIGWDDWLTLPALVLIVGMCIATLVGVAHHAVGFVSPPIEPGKTILNTSSFEQRLTRSTYWGIEVLQVPALGAVKTSLILFYRRPLCQGSVRVFRILTSAALAIIAVWTVSFFFTFLFICPGKPDAYWTTLEEEKKICINTVMVHNSYGITDVMIDLIVIILPIPMVWSLQMSASKKLGVVGIFSLGAASIVASVFRMVTYLESTRVEFEPGTDTDILITGGIYWSLVESGTALISCCLPIVHGLFRRNARRRLDSTQNTSHTASRHSFLSNRLHNRAAYDEFPIEILTLTEAKGRKTQDCFAPADEILVTKTMETTQQKSERREP